MIKKKARAYCSCWLENRSDVYGTFGGPYWDVPRTWARRSSRLFDCFEEKDVRAFKGEQNLIQPNSLTPTSFPLVRTSAYWTPFNRYPYHFIFIKIV
jgi:hypothetical protein